MPRVTTATAKTRLAALGAVAALALAGCSSCGSPSASPSGAPASSGSASSAVDEASRALLPASIRDSGKLTVANGLDYPPFEYLTPDGKQEGVDIDLLHRLTDTLGLQLNIVQVPFDGEIAGLQSKRFDLAMATFTISPERRKQVDFVQFLTAGTVVSTLNGKDAGITGVDTLCGHKVGVQNGSIAQAQVVTINDQCTKAGSPAIAVSVFPSQATLVQGLLNGRVEARLDDSTTAAYINKQTGNKLMEIGQPYEPSPLGFAINKDNGDLLKASQSAMQHLIDDGQYTDLLNKWGQSVNAVQKATVYTTTEPAPSASPSN